MILAEIDLLNDLFYRLGHEAEVRPDTVMVAGDSYIVYGIQMRGRTRQSHIIPLVGDAAEELTAYRGKDVSVRIHKLPFGFEVAHPYPAPLSWKSAPLKEMPPMSLVLGRRYTRMGVRDIAVNLDSIVHVLAAGATGAGKTTLARTALCSLGYNTSPEDLGIILIDPKNRDLLPFRHMPHVISFAHKPDEIVDIMGWLKDEMDRRTDLLEPPKQRLLVVIAELRNMIADAPLSLSYLLSLASRGRSERITLWGDTQYPTASELGGRKGGGLIKSSFGLRMVGMVPSVDASNFAAGIKGVGAEKLDVNGAWLLVYKTRVQRLQSFLMEADDAVPIVAEIRGKWNGAAAPVLPTMPVDQMAPVVKSKVSISRLQTVDEALGDAATAFTDQDKLLAFDCLPIVREEYNALLNNEQTKQGIITRLFENGLFSAAYRGGRNARVLSIAILLVEADPPEASRPAEESEKDEALHVELPRPADEEESVIRVQLPRPATMAGPVIGTAGPQGGQAWTGI